MANSIAECPLPLVFRRIYRERLSGCLEVEAGGTQNRLFFNEGELRAARSDDPDFRLGALLVATGSISPIDLNLFDPLLRVRGEEQVGTVLVDLGLISAPILEQALKTQMIRISAALFPLTEGCWDFQTGRCEADVEPGSAPASATLMMAGVNKIKDFSFYRQRFASLCPKPVELPKQASPRPSPIQRAFIERIGRHFPCPGAEIADRLKMDETFCWRTLLLFFLLGWIDFTIGVADSSQVDFEETVVSAGKVVEAPDKKKDMQTILEEATGIPGFSEQPEPQKKETLSPETPPYQPVQMPPVDSEPVQAQPEAAQASAEAAADQDLNAEQCYELAERDFAGRNYYAAVGWLEKALRKGPERAKYHLLLGRARMQVPRLRHDAESSFLRLARLESWNAEPYYYLGELYLLEGMVQKAERQFQKALELNLEHSRAGFRLDQLLPGRPRKKPDPTSGRK